MRTSVTECEVRASAKEREKEKINEEGAGMAFKFMQMWHFES